MTYDVFSGTLNPAQSTIHLWAHSLSKGDEHPPTLFTGYGTLDLLLNRRM